MTHDMDFWINVVQNNKITSVAAGFSDVRARLCDMVVKRFNSAAPVFEKESAVCFWYYRCDISYSPLTCSRKIFLHNLHWTFYLFCFLEGPSPSMSSIECYCLSFPCSFDFCLLFTNKEENQRIAEKYAFNIFIATNEFLFIIEFNEFLFILLWLWFKLLTSWSN